MNFLKMFGFNGKEQTNKENIWQTTLGCGKCPGCDEMLGSGERPESCPHRIVEEELNCKNCENPQGSPKCITFQNLGVCPTTGRVRRSGK